MKKTTPVKKTAKSKNATKAKKSSRGGGTFYAKSKRLGFRFLEAGDAKLYCGLFTDAKTMEFVGEPLSQDRAERSFNKALELSHARPIKQRISVIVDRASKKAVGISSIRFLEKHRAEGGLMFSSDAHAKRYSIESSLALIDQAFLRHPIEELSAQVAVNHKVGEKLVVGSGYTHIADLAPGEGRPARRCWSIHRDKWIANYKHAKL